MTFRTPKEHDVVARALTNPRPAFVSIVKAGANQVPLLSVKSADIHERVKAMKLKGYEVQKIVLAKGEKFPDTKAATAWLEAGGYPVDSVKDTETGFEVENTENKFIEGSVVQIEAGEVGITIWAGKIEGSAQTEATRGEVIAVVDVEGKKVEDSKTKADPVAETAEKAISAEDKAVIDLVRAAVARKSVLYGAETVAKFDGYMAYVSEAMTLGGVLDDANDGIPAGFGEAVTAMVTAVRNNISAGNPEGARQVASDFGDLVVALVAAFGAFEAASEAVEMSAEQKAQRTQRAAAMTKVTDKFVAALPKIEKKAETVDEDTDKAGGKKPMDDEDEKDGKGKGNLAPPFKKKNDEDAPEAKPVVKDDPDAVLTAIRGLAEKVDANQVKTDAAIGEVQRQVAETAKKVETAEAGLVERVGKLETVRQTRKGADADTTGNPAPAKKGPIEGLALRSALGISNVSHIGGFRRK